MCSTKLPVLKSSTPANDRLPVAPPSLPVDADTAPLASNAPLLVSNVPETERVNVALLAVNVTVPAMDATAPVNPVIVKLPSVVPCKSPPPMTCACVTPPPASCPLALALMLCQPPAACAGTITSVLMSPLKRKDARTRCCNRMASPPPPQHLPRSATCQALSAC